MVNDMPVVVGIKIPSRVRCLVYSRYQHERDRMKVTILTVELHPGTMVPRKHAQCESLRAHGTVLGREGFQKVVHATITIFGFFEHFHTFSQDK